MGMNFVVAARMWDLRKCYEHVRHFRLAHAVEAVEFPMQIARVAMAMYKTERYLSLDKAMAPPVSPLMGIIAGCTNAMALLKVYMVRELDQFVLNYPSVILNMYVDDGSILSAGARHKVFTAIVEASKEVDIIFEHDLELPLARNKGELIASDEELGRALTKGLGNKYGKLKNM